MRQKNLDVGGLETANYLSTAAVQALLPGARVDIVSECEPFTMARCVIALQPDGSKMLRDVVNGKRWKIKTYVTYHFESTEE